VCQQLTSSLNLLSEKPSDSRKAAPAREIEKGKRERSDE